MRVALCQTNSTEDVEANTQQVERLLAEAGAAAVDLVALPEVWPCQGSAIASTPPKLPTPLPE